MVEVVVVVVGDAPASGVRKRRRRMCKGLVTSFLSSSVSFIATPSTSPLRDVDLYSEHRTTARSICCTTKLCECFEHQLQPALTRQTTGQRHQEFPADDQDAHISLILAVTMFSYLVYSVSFAFLVVIGGS